MTLKNQNIARQQAFTRQQRSDPAALLLNTGSGQASSFSLHSMSTSSAGGGGSPTTGDECCPICLESLPALTFRGTEQHRLLCCGKMVCTDCSSLLHKHQDTSAERVREGRLGDTSSLQADVKILLTSLKCPMCREQLPCNDRERFLLVKSRAEQHHWAWAQLKLGLYYKTGVSVPVNQKKAALWFSKAAKQGNFPQAAHEYGICFQMGRGVETNVANACKWYEQAVALGFALSQYQLGDILLSGRGGVRKDITKGVRLIQQAAEQGVHAAQCELAYCCENGIGVQPSLDNTLFWNKKAAEQGNTTAMGNYAGNLLASAAMNNGGRCDLVGRSTVPEAMYWARKAVAEGNVEAKSLVDQMESGCKLCGKCLKRPSSSVALKTCSRCQAIGYCGAECQRAHWKAGHKRDCFDVAGKNKE